MTIEQQACANTDRELWRRDGGEACDPDNFYQPSIHVTKEGAIGINVGGYVYVKPVEEWHKLAGGKEAMQPKEPLSSNPRLPDCMVGPSEPCAAFQSLTLELEEARRVAAARLHVIESKVAEIERLTAERDSLKAAEGLSYSIGKKLEAERDRLKATVEELRTVSAGSRAALKGASRLLAENMRSTTHWTGCESAHWMCRMGRLIENALAGAADEKQSESSDGN